MQQAINLVSMISPNPPQAGQMPVQGGSQTGVAAGLFQALLLEALTGVQSMPGTQVAAGVPTAPAEPVPGDPPVVSEPAPPVAEAPSGAPPAVPIRLTGPMPPVPVPVEIKTLPAEAQLPVPALPEAAAPPLTPEDAAEPAPAPEEETVQTLMAQVQVVQAQVVQAQVVQTQAAAAPAPSTAEAPQPQTPDQPTATISGDEPADPRLEAFVQKAVRSVQGDGQAMQTPEQRQSDPQPTFQDLVKLVVDAEKAPTTHPQPTATDAAPAPPVKAQSRSRKAETAPDSAPAVTLAHDPTAVSRDTAPTGGTDAAQPAPRQPVEPEQVLRQVTRFVKVMVDSKQSEVRLLLHPEHLGSVAVKLVVGDGALRANLVAHDAAVKAALEANLDQLKTRLSGQGFEVEQVHVTVGGDGGFSHPQHSRQGEQRQAWQQPRSQNWAPRGQEDSGPTVPQRQAPPSWSSRGTGARLNSLV